MQLYNKNNALLLDIPVDDKSYRLKEIMGENVLTLYFSSSEFVELPLGSWCEFRAEKYYLFNPENFTKIHSRSYDYTLVMYGAYRKASTVKFKFFTMNGTTPEGPYRLKFSLTATPEEFGRLIVNNLNLNDADKGWTLGECITAEPVTLDFNHEYCDAALTKIIDAFKTEYDFENKTLSIGPIEKLKESPIDLSYGYDNGILSGLQRTQYDDSKVINRVYIQGGSENINAGVYGNTTLLLPRSTEIAYNGKTYITDASGSYVERLDRTGDVVDDSLDVSEIKPSWTGTVSGVVAVDDTKSLYDIIDSSIPSGLDFSQVVMPGETMTIIFQTGDLSGKEFDVAYDHALRRFAIVPTTDNGVNFPQAPLVPGVGDQYAVFHITLPTSYVSQAETKALNKSVEYLDSRLLPQFTYKWTLDELYAKRNWLAIGGFLNVGYFVLFHDDQFLTTPVAIRIISVKDYVNKPKSPVIEIANNVSAKSFSSVINSVTTQEQTIERLTKAVAKYAKRGLKASQQTIEMLSEAFAGFGSAINPVAVQTMAILLGDESLQFYYVNNKTNPVQVDDFIAYSESTKQLSIPAGIIQHMTLGITTISPTHSVSEYKFWDMSAYVSPVLDDGSKKYYFYAKVSKTVRTGTYELSETAKGIESVAGYYYLLVGILNSEIDGTRGDLVPFYGYSEITPGRVRANKFISADGNTFIDLLNGVIQGNFKFQSSGKNIEEVVDKTVATADVEFYLSISKTALSGGEWSTLAPVWSEGKFMWSRTKVILTDGTTSYTPSENGTCIAGATGATLYTWIKYADTVAGAGLSDDPTGKLYIGLAYNKSTATESTTPGDYSWSLIKGDTGTGIESATAEYYLSTSKTVQSGGSWITTSPTWSSGMYLWSRIKIVYKNPTSTAYTTPVVDSSWEAVNAIQVGGRNLLINSANIQTFGGDFPSACTSAINTVNGFKEEVITSLVNSAQCYRYKYPFFDTMPRSNTDYVLSFDYKTNQSGGNIHIDVRTSSHTDPIAFDFSTPNTNGEWKRGFIVCNFAITIQTNSLLSVQAPPTVGGYTGYRKLQFEIGNKHGNIHLRCKGGYRKLQFEIGNKPSDYTEAPEDTEARIIAAKIAADASNAAIAEMTNDDKITPVEKKSMKTEWNTIDNEVAGIRSQADAFSVDRTTYNTKYTALYTTIFTNLNDLTTTWILGTGGGALLRTKFQEYYNARTALLNAIATAAKTQAIADATAKVNAIEAGGRNLVIMSNSNQGVAVSPQSNGKSGWGFTITTPWTSAGFLMQNLAVNTNYMVSFIAWCEMTGGGTTPLQNDFYPDTLPQKGYTINTTPTRYSYLLNTAVADIANCSFRFFPEGTVNSPIHITDIQIKRGTLLQDHTAAPEDDKAALASYDYLKTALAGSTDITGGILATNVLLMKNSLNQIVAGLSGLTGDKVASWHGGTYAQAVADAAKAFKATMETAGLDRKDGAGHRAKGNLAWNAAGDVFIRGILEVLSGGKLGNFDIVNGNIIGYDENTNERVRISTDNIPESDSILSTWATLKASSDWSDQMTATDTAGATLITGNDNLGPDAFTINYATKVRFSMLTGTSTYTSIQYPERVSSYSSVRFHLIIKKNDVTVYEGDYAPGTEIQLNTLGEYKYYIQMFPNIKMLANCSTVLTITTPVLIEYLPSVEKTAIGKDGCYSFLSLLEYLHFKSGAGFTAKVSASDKWNTPGVLASGSVALGGGLARGFGALLYNTEKTGTGIYRIYHRITHTNFAVSVTLQGSIRLAYVSTKTAYTGVDKSGYAEVKITTTSGTLVSDTGFDFIISGLN